MLCMASVLKKTPDYMFSAVIFQNVLCVSKEMMNLNYTDFNKLC